MVVMVFALVHVLSGVKGPVLVDFEKAVKSFKKDFGDVKLYGIHGKCDNIYPGSCDYKHTIVYIPSEAMDSNNSMNTQFARNEFVQSKDLKLFQVRRIFLTLLTL